MGALVSLICGCYNGEKFIHRCFQSVLRQTYPHVEVIFVDDGSTDQSLKLAESFKEQFDEKAYQFIIISQKNLGFYPQSGIKIATGKYISTLDIDDELLPESIEKRVNFLEKYPIFSAVRTNGFYVYNTSLQKKPELFVQNVSEKNKTDIFEDLLLGKTNNWAGSYMVKASELFKIYPNKTVPMNRYGQNLQILMPVAYKNKIGFIDEPEMFYHKHEDSFTSSKQYFQEKKLYEEFKKIRLEILNILNINDIDLLRKLDETYQNIFLNLAYQYNNTQEFNIIFQELKTKTNEQKLMYHWINKNILSFYTHRLKYWIIK